MLSALPNISVEDKIIVRSRHSGGRRSSGVASSAALAGKVRGPEWKKKVSLEVPGMIQQKFRDVKFKTLVGLSDVLPLAWYAVDDTVYLWPFTGEGVTVIQSDGIVTAVSIGVPTPNVLGGDIVAVVVVATDHSVTMVGLDRGLKQIRLEGYFVGNLAGPFTQVAVTVTGRVLMHAPSDPSSVFELRYAKASTWFRSKVWIQPHSLLGDPEGLVSSVFVKLLRFVTPPPQVGAADIVQLHIHGDSTFSHFVVTDSLNLSLLAISPAPSELAISTGSWRHEDVADIKLACVGRILLSDLATTSSLAPKIVSAIVNNVIDSTQTPTVTVTTDSGDILELRLRAERSKDLVVVKSRCGLASSGAAPIADQGGWKKMKVSQTLAVGTKSAAPVTASLGASAVGQGSSVHIAGVEIDVSSTVLSIQRLSENGLTVDSVSSIIFPAMSSETLLVPAAASSLAVLTGKGVVLLEQHAPSETSPDSVEEVLSALTGSPSTLFSAHKAAAIRSLSQDITPPSIADETEFSQRSSIAKPLSGGVWLGGISRYANSLLYVLEREAVFNEKNGKVVISDIVLESVGTRISNLVKFIRAVLAVVAPNGVVGELKGTEAFRWREWMHTESRQLAAQQQAVATLTRTADRLHAIGQTSSFLAIIAQLNPAIPPTLTSSPTTVVALSESRAVCAQLATVLLQQEPQSVARMKESCPSILSLASVGSGTATPPETLAAMIQCAVGEGSRIPQLSESIVAMARTTVDVNALLREVGRITDAATDGKLIVVVAVMEGLQTRLVDQAVLGPLLAWAGTSLSRSENDSVLDFLTQRGYTDNLHLAASVNQFVHQYLLARVDSSPVAGTVLARVMLQSGRNMEAADLLDQLALGRAGLDLESRLALLVEANTAYSTKARLERIVTVKHIQLPLVSRLGSNNEAPATVSERVLTISDLHHFATEFGFHDLVLACYVFVPVKDAELVKSWALVLFAGTFSQAVELVETLRELTDQVGVSGSLWRKVDVVVALLMYREAIEGQGGVVLKEVVGKTLSVAPLHAVEMLVRILRQLNVWLPSVPRQFVGGSAALSASEVKAHVSKELLNAIDSFAQELAPMKDRVESLLILAKPHLSDSARADELIERLGRTGKRGTVFSLPSGADHGE